MMYLFMAYKADGTVKGLVEVHGMVGVSSARALAESFYPHVELTSDPGFRQDGDVAIDATTSRIYDARDGIPGPTAEELAEYRDERRHESRVS